MNAEVRQVLDGAVQALTSVTVLVHRINVVCQPRCDARRALTDTVAGIRPADVPRFMVAQLAGATTANVLFRFLVPSLPRSADRVVVPRSEVPAS